LGHRRQFFAVSVTSLPKPRQCALRGNGKKRDFAIIDNPELCWTSGQGSRVHQNKE
jgi:hypothetical protein